MGEIELVKPVEKLEALVGVLMEMMDLPFAVACVPRR
jgi:hypothetical protein